MKSSRPTRLSALLEQTLARFGLDRRLDDYRVWQAWDEVVGRAISRNAQPVRLDGPRLVVTVRSSTWLQELRLLEAELVARLNEWMGREVVGELFFVIGRVEQHVPEAATRDAAKASSSTRPPGRMAAAEASAGEDVDLPRSNPGQVASTGARREASASRAASAEPPSRAPGLPVDAAAAIERLWKAARDRDPG